MKNTNYGSSVGSNLDSQIGDQITTFNYIDDNTKINQDIKSSTQSNIKEQVDIDSTTINTHTGDITSINMNPEGEKYNSTSNYYEKYLQKTNNSYGSNYGTKGIPGYSYLKPEFYNVPQQRNPVCVSNPSNCHEPVGYLSGGNSNFMEFQR